MTHKALITAFLIFLVDVLFVTSIWGWDDTVTHKDLTEQAVLISVLHSSKKDYLEQVGFTDIDQILHWEGHVCDDNTKETECSIKEWLRYGAEKEDAESSIISGRFNNHFHNPLNGEGIDDWEVLIYHVTGQSCLAWAQDSAAQAADGMPEGDQSWPTLRELYYDALTASGDTQRRELFARLFILFYPYSRVTL